MNIIIIDSNMMLRTDLKKRFGSEGHLIRASFAKVADVVRQLNEDPEETVELALIASSVAGQSAAEIVATLRALPALAKTHFVLLLEESDSDNLAELLELSWLGCVRKPCGVDNIFHYVQRMHLIFKALKNDRALLQNVIKAQLAESGGDINAAAKYLQKVIASIEHPWFLFDLGRYYSMLKRPEEALRAFGLARGIAPQLSHQIAAFLGRYALPELKKVPQIPQYALREFESGYDAPHVAPLGIDGVASIIIGGGFSPFQKVTEELFISMGVPDVRCRPGEPDLFRELEYKSADIVFLPMNNETESILQLMVKSHNFPGTKIVAVFKGEQDLSRMAKLFLGGVHWFVEASASPLQIKEAMHLAMVTYEMTMNSGQARPLSLASYYAYRYGLLDEAMELSRQALEIFPLAGFPFVLQGLIHIRRGNMSNADECFERAIRNSPELAGLCQRLRSHPDGATRPKLLPIQGLAS